MEWIGEVLKNPDGVLDELNLDLNMRLKVSENIPWYAAIFGGVPALAGGFIFENIIDWKFNLLDLVFNSVSIATFNVLSIYYRKLWFRTKRQRRPTLRNSLKEVALKIEDGSMVKKNKSRKHKIEDFSVISSKSIQTAPQNNQNWSQNNQIWLRTILIC